MFNDNIIQARRDRRKAERKWRKTGLPSDLIVFKVKRKYVVHPMNEAKCTHYRQFTDKNSSDQSKLFRASKSLLNLQEDKSLPPHTNASVLTNEMGEYFIHKVFAIRSKLAGDAVPHAVSTECAPQGSSSTDDVVTLSEFQSLSEEAVRKMAVASMKTCALDPFPSSILLVCIEELLPVITKMLNISLEQSFKPSDTFSEVEAVSAMQKCICDVRAWMREDQLMLNDDKTEFLIIGTGQQLSKVSIQSIQVGQAEVFPVVSARNLGTCFDTHLDMGTHITKTCSSAFYYLYNIYLFIYLFMYLFRHTTQKIITRKEMYL